MLKFSLPRAVCLPPPKSAPDVPLDKNAVYQYLVELDQKLRNAKDSMEPYFKRYERSGGKNIFKTATSNFESFKFTRNIIAQNRNTPSVSNAWIKAYELISEFELIPESHTMKEEKRSQWNHFDNCSFPGSFILAIYHYVYTRRDEDFQALYNWFGSSLLAEHTQDKDHPDAALGDQYELYKRYSGNDSADGIDHWLMDPSRGLNGDILDLDYLTHIHNMLSQKHFDRYEREDHKESNDHDGQVDLYTSEFGIDVSEKKMYNEQEFVHAKGDLAQIICGLQTLRKDGHMVCKIFTFFNPFTLSLLALMRECFEEFYICKPVSSKPDNSEVFIIGKEFNPDTGAEAAEIMLTFLKDPNSDYKSGTLVPLNKLDNKFWKRIKEAAYKIFEELQIERIKNNIVVFERIIAKIGDPNTNPEIEDKVKKMSREEYASRIDDDNKTWFAAYPVLVLHKKHRLNIIDITERTAPRPRNYQDQNRYNSNQNRYPSDNSNRRNYDGYKYPAKDLKDHDHYDRRPEEKDADGFQTVHNRRTQRHDKKSFSTFGKGSN
jgi:23S rRNA U2552 (ribose-2'-O)-methylase RlmE/FtsJ